MASVTTNIFSANHDYPCEVLSTYLLNEIARGGIVCGREVRVASQDAAGLWVYFYHPDTEVRIYTATNSECASILRHLDQHGIIPTTHTTSEEDIYQREHLGWRSRAHDRRTFRYSTPMQVRNKLAGRVHVTPQFAAEIYEWVKREIRNERSTI